MPRPRSHRHDAIIGARYAGAATARLLAARGHDVLVLDRAEHDVLAVMAAVGSERAVLCGYSEGGPMALMLAAMHPERVHSLVLYGSYARRTWAADYPWAQKQGDRALHTEALVTRWDGEEDLPMRCPFGDADMQRWWTHRMRASATPGTIRALMDMTSLVDVRDLLPKIRVPALVVHRTGDALFSPGGPLPRRQPPRRDPGRARGRRPLRRGRPRLEPLADGSLRAHSD
jgi:pimeloyl-ACP methyl ester carboxylesterase